MPSLVAADGQIHCVYLLRNTDAKCRGKCYAGYSPQPFIRVRRHNGLLSGGAKYTKRYGCGSWSIGMVVAGFPSSKAALQFEWAIQHSARSSRLLDTLGDRWLAKRKADPKKYRSFKKFMASNTKRTYSQWRENMLGLFAEQASQEKKNLWVFEDRWARPIGASSRVTPSALQKPPMLQGVPSSSDAKPDEPYKLILPGPIEPEQ